MPRNVFNKFLSSHNWSLLYRFGCCKEYVQALGSLSTMMCRPGCSVWLSGPQLPSNEAVELAGCSKVSEFLSALLGAPIGSPTSPRISSGCQQARRRGSWGPESRAEHPDASFPQMAGVGRGRCVLKNHVGGHRRDLGDNILD